MNKPTANKIFSTTILALSLTMGTPRMVSAQNQIVIPEKRTFVQKIFSFFARRAYGNAMVETPEQQQSQKYLDMSDGYQQAVNRASILGFVQRGQIKHYEIPVYQIALLIFRKQIGVEPVSIWIQGVKNPQQDAYGVIVAGDDKQNVESISKAVFMTSDNVGSAMGSGRAQFSQYLAEDLKDCAGPCKRRAITSLFNPVVDGSLAVGHFEAAMAAYVLSIAKSADCGGCAMNGCLQAFSDYVFAMPVKLQPEHVSGSAAESSQN